MTDDLAMDLDLDGPEKNVYVVNPKQPTTFNVSIILFIVYNIIMYYVYNI